MSEVLIITASLIAVYFGHKALSFFLTAKKQRRIIKEEMSEILNSPRYKVRGKYE